jgi:NAD(P)-dependent dehydrogenase (short-subunit alcohol dehydrogenase family)
MTALKQLFDLTGRIALITGGSRGLGLQIAEALGEFGATTILVARKQAELDEAVTHLTGLGYSAAAIAADLGDADGIGALIDRAVAEHGPIDILVNNAGAAWGEPAEDHSMAGWNKVINLNVTGLFLLTQAAAKTCFIPNGGGAIVNVASIEGMQGHHPRQAGTIAYNTAKGAVVNMTRALAAEWGDRKIRVNAIAPGYFPSKMTAATLDKVGTHLIEGTPLGKLGGPDDLKGAALLLASDAGGHITGQIIVVDGGSIVI